MTRWNKIKPLLAKIVNAGLFMIGGAWLLTQYLSYKGIAQDQELERLGLGLMLLFFIGLIIYPRPEGDRNPVKDPSPRWSGTVTILMTGFPLAAATLFNRDARDFALLPVIIIICTLLIAFLVWRFASKNADEIGEARFNPKPPAK